MSALIDSLSDMMARRKKSPANMPPHDQGASTSGTMDGPDDVPGAGSGMGTESPGASLASHHGAAMSGTPARPNPARPGTSYRRPPAPYTASAHDCSSLAALWGLGTKYDAKALLDATRAAGVAASISAKADTPGGMEGGVGQGQSAGHGEEELVMERPGFRVELGGEPVRRVALSRYTSPCAASASSLPPATKAGAHSEHGSWHRDVTATEAGVLENLSDVYFGGKLCAGRQNQVVIESQDPGAFYYRHCFYRMRHQNYVGTDESCGPVALSVVREELSPAEAGQAALQSRGIWRLVVRVSEEPTMRVSIAEDALTDYLLSNPANSGGSGAGTAQSGAAGQSGVGQQGAQAAQPPAQGAQHHQAAMHCRVPLRELLELTAPHLNISTLRLAVPGPRTEEMLLKLDEQPIYNRYKVGVLLSLAGQSSEEEMYNNEYSTPALDEFLDMMGQRVRLKGFSGYKGGLDTRGDTTGMHSVYATHQQHQVMFHVATMLPFTPSNRQQLSRKRHIGNDMVTIIFQEPGAQPFDPSSVRSHFQHVFLVVRANKPCTEQTSYTLAVARSSDVPSFGPAFPSESRFHKSTEFRDFLLTKVINAENAVHRSARFAAMGARTRHETLKDLVENYGSAQPAEPQGNTRIASRLLGGAASSVKSRASKPSAPARPTTASCLRGALSWDLLVDDYSLGSAHWVVLGLSADSLVLLEIASGDVIFACPTHAILGWMVGKNSLKLYYDHGSVLSLRWPNSNSCQLGRPLLLDRLSTVTKGTAAQELTLRQSHSGHVEFHVQEEGVVTEVEMYGGGWQAGLRQGSRIIEINSISVCTMSPADVRQALGNGGDGKSGNAAVMVAVIAPAADGSPRRGCEDPHCPAVLGGDPLAQSAAEIGATVPQPPARDSPLRAGPLRGDQGYESGTLSSGGKDDHGAQQAQQQRQPNGDRDNTSPNWTEPTSGGGHGPVGHTASDAQSSDASEQGNGGAHGNNVPACRRPIVGPKGAAVAACHSEPEMCVAGGGRGSGWSPPPLPPRTYQCRTGAHSLHDHMLTECRSQGELARTQSEQRLLEYAAWSPDGRPPPQRATDAQCDALVAAAKMVLADNSATASVHICLQNALHKVKILENRLQTIADELTKEKAERGRLECELATSRQLQKKVTVERDRALSDLHRAQALLQADTGPHTSL